MTEAKLLQSKVVRGEEDNGATMQSAVAIQQQQQLPVVVPRRSPISKPTTSSAVVSQHPSTAYSPAHMQMRMEQMSAHEKTRNASSGS